jgi:hypothetical protein
MEETFKVLHYCDNHWKSHHLATKNYPQWYKHYHFNKKQDDGEDVKPTRRSSKKKKVAIDEEGDETGDGQSNADTDMTSEASDEAASPSSLDVQTRDGPAGGSSRPKPRPLANPL